MLLEPEILYHYCSIDTFREIINNKTIRLSNIFKMNDFSEVIHVLKFLPHALLEEYKKDSLPFTYKGLYNENIFDLIVSDINKSINKVKYLSYIACFSESEDDLGQWNRYGDDGKGIAIGYDRKILFETAGQYPGIQIKKVIYDENKQMQYVKDDFIPLIFKAIKEAGNNENVRKGFFSYDDMVQIHINSYMSALLLSAVEYKHEKYKDEKEWRLFLNTPEITELYNNESIKKYLEKEQYGGLVRGKISFINKADKGITSYMDLSFENFNNATHLIKKIILGPKSKIHKEDLDLRLFLYINNVNIGHPCIANTQIQQSTIPYF